MAKSKEATIEEAGSLVEREEGMAVQEAVRVELPAIETLIKMARRFPRDMTLSMQRARNAALFSPEYAALMNYTLPGRRKRGEEGAGKPIEGPSVRLAEVLIPAWGNLYVGTRITHEGERFVTAQGVGIDFENNALVTFEVSRRITDSYGNRYGDDMIQMTKQAAQAIAKRQTVFSIIPRVFVEDLWAESKDIALGKKDGLEARRAAALTKFEGIGVSLERVLSTLEVGDVTDINWDHIGLLLGYFSAIKTGEATAHDIFPPLIPVGQAVTPGRQRADGTAPRKPRERAAAPSPAAEPAAPRSGEQPTQGGDLGNGATEGGEATQSASGTPTEPTRATPDSNAKPQAIHESVNLDDY
jgi:hypothetical protein